MREMKAEMMRGGETDKGGRDMQTDQYGRERQTGSRRAMEGGATDSSGPTKGRRLCLPSQSL